MLEFRKLPTDGTKKVLLQRLQTDLPFVVVDIDSRECLQRLICSFLYHMKWDPIHLFECTMPARGPLKVGRGNIRKRKKLDPADLSWSHIERTKCIR
mmetsp:Transcript_30509/g.45150  ORF Transcript_30509/g.45150 Transcript_30509/m.45150 type:complete len:97 (+) Transcript_30509:352-642(+)